MNEVEGGTDQKNEKAGAGGEVYERLERDDGIHEGEMS